MACVVIFNRKVEISDNLYSHSSTMLVQRSVYMILYWQKA